MTPSLISLDVYKGGAERPGALVVRNNAVDITSKVQFIRLLCLDIYCAKLKKECLMLGAFSDILCVWFSGFCVSKQKFGQRRNREPGYMGP